MVGLLTCFDVRLVIGTLVWRCSLNGQYSIPQVISAPVSTP
ncbi:hypothetical protein SAMN02745124_02427 [Desulfofustis glycolicus DSM 9705]|uniref:Uncharacterized protein n=1 Tax=Desulfofustis glycolicus DSM 9705 TaxID=1121409 RepID=A0A1M5WPJ6_9BACT|nr:hypothetical protein SAMN02745124_02427 [Desulfofustis glycolicus DSM 9705]